MIALKNPFRGARIPSALRARFEEERLATNINRMRGFAIYIIVLQVLLNIINIIVPQIGVTGNVPGMPISLDWYIGLSLLTLALGIVYFILLTLTRAGKISSRAVKIFLVQSLLYCYSVIQLTFLTLNMLSNQGFGGFVIFILMFSMIPILPRRQSIATIAIAFAYLLVFTLATQGLSGEAVSPYTGETYVWTVTTFSEFLYTDWRANLVIISVVSAFVSAVVYELYVANFLKSTELVEHNNLLEHRVAERTAALVEKTEAAEEASRAKSRFLVSISHEVRTPLNAIMGMTHVARKNSDSAKTLRALDQIEHSSTLLLELLNDVLDMGGIETGQLRITRKRFSLAKVLQEVVSSSSACCAQKAITLRSTVEEVADYTVMGDRLRLAQVLLNLLDNAMKYSPEDSTVDLKIAAVEGDLGTVHVSFTIADEGIGMDAETLSHLFTPFEQGSTEGMKHAGLGLGLTVSQALVELMGGHIEVSSELGRGSTFSFVLDFDLAESAGENAVPLPDLTNRHILSVEDIAINRDILRELIEETNAIVDEAFDGAEAVERFTASPVGYYDLIFMDLLMPHLNGYEATYAIRALGRADAAEVPIVALSANAYPDDVEKSLAAGMNAHISKPVDFAILMKTLDQYLGGQTPLV
ncbi:MAG: response regulator [Coriobacteriales bacterium]|jgi:signal transduction histidine kinase/CheY-like chemotaxis protein|nr:response regulator [Coriobacteriales bacterium]